MSFKTHRREFGVGAAILLICLLMAVAAPRFFTAENQLDLLVANAPVLIIAVGMTLVILTANIDISVGSQFAICAVASGMLAKMGLPIVLSAVVTCAIGGLLGALNGGLTAYMRIPSIVVTLATMVALRDSLRWTTEGAWVQNLPSGFQWFGLTQFGSATLTCGLAVLIALTAAWALQNAAAGRAVYATGSDPTAARLAGINGTAVTFWAFVITGALTGCAAVLNATRFNQIPSNSGIGLELKVIAAVVVGGTSITGGKGSVVGTVLGVILLGLVGPALTFLGVSAYWERAIQGAIILVAVGMEGLQRPTAVRRLAVAR